MTSKRKSELNREEDKDEDGDNKDSGAADVLGGPSIQEADTSRSLAACLNLARARGYVDDKTKRQPSASTSNAKKVKIEAKAYMVEEKRGGDRRDTNNRSRGRGGEQLREVRDPEDYKPEIKLVYTDDRGKKLEKPKDAYKYMCYKFHGIEPGKNKIDKRLRQEKLMMQGKTTELPASASLMISKQEELKTPYIILEKGK